MSIVSNRRRAAKRERWRRTLALISRTGTAYVSPDIWERFGRLGHRGVGLPADIEVVSIARLAPGTIAGFDFERFAPLRLLYEQLGEIQFPTFHFPKKEDFDRMLWRAQ